MANETQWPLDFDWVDVDCEGYTSFEGLGLGERVARGRGAQGGKKNRDLSHYVPIFRGIGTAEASCGVTGAPAVVI